MDSSLIISSFVAGFLTFLAPCTLPLVPGYLAFISGVSLKDLQNPARVGQARLKIFFNGLFYVIGFSAVFMFFGSLFAFGGGALAGYRHILARIGGAFVIFFGLYMMHVFRLPMFSFLQRDFRFNPTQKIKPGNPFSSFIFGATFALGWTPCVGPILGSILLLATFSQTFVQGAFLLGIFSLGLAVPFLIVALGISWFARFFARIQKIVAVSSFIGGLFLVFLGVLLVTGSFGWWLSYAYQLFDFVSYDSILKFL